MLFHSQRSSFWLLANWIGKTKGICNPNNPLKELEAAILILDNRFLAPLLAWAFRLSGSGAHRDRTRRVISCVSFKQSQIRRTWVHLPVVIMLRAKPLGHLRGFEEPKYCPSPWDWIRICSCEWDPSYRWWSWGARLEGGHADRSLRKLEIQYILTRLVTESTIPLWKSVMELMPEPR